MKFLDLRKYFCANLYALSFYYGEFLRYRFANIEWVDAGHNVFPSAKALFFANMMTFYFSINIICASLTILEILIRKFVIEKNFPNFRFSFGIKIPKVIVFIYTVLFYIGLIPAIGFSLLGLLFLLVYNISEILVSFNI